MDVVKTLKPGNTGSSTTPQPKSPSNAAQPLGDSAYRMRKNQRSMFPHTRLHETALHRLTKKTGGICNREGKSAIRYEFAIRLGLENGLL